MEVVYAAFGPPLPQPLHHSLPEIQLHFQVLSKETFTPCSFLHRTTETPETTNTRSFLLSKHADGTNAKKPEAFMEQVKDFVTHLNDSVASLLQVISGLSAQAWLEFQQRQK